MKFKDTAYIWLAVAVLIIGGLLWTTTERFTPQFIDQSQTARTVRMEDSSYTQATNHFTPTPNREMMEVPGVPGKDQVNQWNAHVV